MKKFSLALVGLLIFLCCVPAYAAKSTTQNLLEVLLQVLAQNRLMFFESSDGVVTEVLKVTPSEGKKNMSFLTQNGNRSAINFDVTFIPGPQDTLIGSKLVISTKPTLEMELISIGGNILAEGKEKKDDGTETTWKLMIRDTPRK